MPIKCFFNKQQPFGEIRKNVRSHVLVQKKQNKKIVLTTF